MTSKTDEQAAEEHAIQYEAKTPYQHFDTRNHYVAGFKNGCTYKAQQLANGKLEWDEKAADVEWDRKQNMWSTQSKSFLFKWGCRFQLKQLAPIINAQAEKIKAADELIGNLEAALLYYKENDEGTGANEYAIDALAEIEKWKVGK